MRPLGAARYAANIFSGDLSILDTATGELLASIPVGSGPNGIVLLPNRAGES
ncbi:MAG: hypothetical protein HY534_06145 [Chloroflexi bacterium]|nr:hypothetical protein [Chloroflexota bacterium]